VLQHRLGIKKGFAFDINAVCSGFIYGLVNADSLIASNQCKNMLVVGTELYSRIINPNDRTTCVLFGDGAGAVVLTRAEETGSANGLRGIYASELHSDGNMKDILCVPSGTAKSVTSESIAKGEHYLFMQGREVFKLAVRSLAEVSESLLKKVGIDISQVDLMISHQANERILLAVGRQLGVSIEKIPMNVQKYGNTSAASLPILLAETQASGRLKKGIWFFYQPLEVG
jgi:3-oxoacyl-[acyl-carrier-protein] synthase III